MAADGAVAAALDSTGDAGTASQRLRRQRILSATVDLAARGGYDGVQMREVAEQADVALGTLYRYFPSKVHLLVSATTEQIVEMRDRLRQRPPAATDPVDRVIEVLDGSTRYLMRNRKLASALLRALMSGDDTVGVEVEAVSRAMTSTIIWALRGDAEPTEQETAVASVLENVWYACMVSWLSGRKKAEAIRAELALATRLLLRDVAT
jgi:AcrR family transcriptional regulator